MNLFILPRSGLSITLPSNDIRSIYWTGCIFKICRFQWLRGIGIKDKPQLRHPGYLDKFCYKTIAFHYRGLYKFILHSRPIPITPPVPPSETWTVNRRKALLPDYRPDPQPGLQRSRTLRSARSSGCPKWPYHSCSIWSEPGRHGFG